MTFSLDPRRLIFILVFLTLSAPLLMKLSVPPVRMGAADKMFLEIENLPTDSSKIVYLALDYGPGTNAESGSQAKAVIEHLLRRRIRFVVTSQIIEAVPIIKDLPDKIAASLTKQYPDQKWEYGRDWVNVGYTPGGGLTIQSVAKAKSLAGFFKRDSRGNNATDLPIFQDLENHADSAIESVSALIQLTAYVGTLENYLQFFSSEKYRPIFLHGCTSIATPQAFIYLDSGQLRGVLEGIAGAAWYGKLLSDRYLGRPVDDSILINTSLGIAHLLVIGLIIAGNIVGWTGQWRRR